MTIDAYAGRLINVGNRDKLIMEAVLGIYKTPIDDKQVSGEKIKSSTALDTKKSMADTTKELVKKCEINLTEKKPLLIPALYKNNTC